MMLSRFKLLTFVSLLKEKLLLLQFATRVQVGKGKVPLLLLGIPPSQ